MQKEETEEGRAILTLLDMLTAEERDSIRRVILAMIQKEK